MRGFRSPTRATARPSAHPAAHAARRSTRAFTLLELIVVLVVLGLVAAIAVPTYQRVVDTAQDRTTLASVSSILRAVSASAALGDTSEFSEADLETAGLEVGELEAMAVPGVSAADVSWVMSLDPEGWSAEYGQLHAGLSADSRTAGIAAKSPTGRCAFARNAIGSRIEAWISTEDIGEDCNATSAISGVGAPSGGGGNPTGPAGAPGAPIITWSDAGDGSFNLDWAEPLDTGDTPITHYELEVDGPNFDVEVDVPNLGHDMLGMFVESGYMSWWNYDGTTYDGEWFDNWTDPPFEPGDVVNGEDYDIAVRAVNDAGAGPAATETLTPAEIVYIQEAPDPPVFVTETSGSSGAPGSEVVWFDATWDPPAYTGTSAITHYMVQTSGPQMTQQVTIPAAEARHFRIEGNEMTWGDAESETLGLPIVADSTYEVQVTAFNETDNSWPAMTWINTPKVPVWEPPPFTAQDPTDLNGATDDGWPAVQQVIVYRRVDQWPGFAYFRVGGGVSNVQFLEAEWSTDGGDTWAATGEPMGMSWTVDEYGDDGRSPVYADHSFYLGQEPMGCGLTYPNQSWSPMGISDYIGGVSIAGIGTVSDYGDGALRVDQIREAFPLNSADGEHRIRLRYTYDTLAGPGLGEGTVVVVHHATRSPTNSTGLNQFGDTC